MIIELNGVRPTIAEDAYIAPTAVLIGNVTVKAGANIWFGAVLRGDTGAIVIGERTSVQDNVVIHVNEHEDTIIGDEVLIGHGAVLEGCAVSHGALIGMGAIILSGAKIGRQSLVAAGALVRENSRIPDAVLVAGVPAAVRGSLSTAHTDRLGEGPAHYQRMAALYRDHAVVVAE